MPTLRQLASKGAALNLVLVCMVAGVLTWMGSMSFHRSAVRMQQPSPNEVAFALVRAGLDAESLAAAGLSAEQTGALVARARTHLNSAIQTLRDADSSFASGKATVDQLQRVVQSGLATQEQKTQYTSAQTQLATLTSARQSALDAVFTAATDGVNQNAVAALQTIKANKAQWEAPCKFLVKNRSQADWVALREALANDRISASLGRTPDPEGQQLIATASADASVVAAASNLSNALGTVSSAWEAAVYP